MRMGTGWRIRRGSWEIRLMGRETVYGLVLCRNQKILKQAVPGSPMLRANVSVPWMTWISIEQRRYCFCI